MKNQVNQPSVFWLLFILGLSLIPSSSFAQQHEAQPQVYIVYIGEHSGEKTENEILDNHHSYLFSVKSSEEGAKASLIYSYNKVINGFSALLTPHEADKLSEMEGVVSVFRSYPRKHWLQTTRSWDFLKLLEGDKAGGDQANHHPYEELLQKANHGKDVIVGVLDSGIWPESQSFNDEGMEPIPKSWKGICQTGVAFNKSHCNRKVIGARYYVKGYEAIYGRLNNSNDYRSPRDKNSHGTHVASTVGGRRVANTSALGGFAYGTATGGAPLVRLAIYKACWPVQGKTNADPNTCQDDDILAGMEHAISDGVHILSMSIGGTGGLDYQKDVIALAALLAEKYNIVVVCSAGNDGPTRSTVTNVAPWILTVAASSVDRDFPSAVLLGNQIKIKGQTVTPFKPTKKMHQLVYAKDVEVPSTPANITSQCLPGTLSRKLVRGKIVICLGVNSQSALEVRRARGAGIIQVFPPLSVNRLLLSSQVLPSTVIHWNDRAAIINYTRDNKNSMAKLIPGMTVLGSRIPAPFMAFFTSLGPNDLQPNILKPDITAPGLNILAAWSEAVSPTKLAGDHRFVKYNFDSGTSMSCPHVSAVAALLKAIHPDWSSAAIRSALMTTARQNNNMGTPMMDASGNIATPFHYGSGHIQPAQAVDPGLVYDTTFRDYLLFLCGSGYDHLAQQFEKFTCPRRGPLPSNLNYPSLAISELNGTMTVRRTVTNVGASKSVYSLKVKPPTGFSVEISPTILSFNQVGEKRKFSITVKTGSVKPQRGRYAFGWYMWSDGIHMVRSPIAVSSA